MKREEATRGGKEDGDAGRQTIEKENSPLLDGGK